MEVKQAGMISEFTFLRVEASHEEVGGPVSVWHILSQKRSKCIRTAARESKVRQQDLQTSRAACHGHMKGVFSGEGEQFEEPSLAVGRWVT